MIDLKIDLKIKKISTLLSTDATFSGTNRHLR